MAPWLSWAVPATVLASRPVTRPATAAGLAIAGLGTSGGCWPGSSTGLASWLVIRPVAALGRQQGLARLVLARERFGR